VASRHPGRALGWPDAGLRRPARRCGGGRRARGDRRRRRAGRVLLHRRSRADGRSSSSRRCRRGGGAGTALVEACAAAARAAGAPRLEVVTTNDNVRALSFYQRRGFASWRCAPGRRRRPPPPEAADPPPREGGSRSATSWSSPASSEARGPSPGAARRAGPVPPRAVPVGRPPRATSGHLGYDRGSKEEGPLASASARSFAAHPRRDRRHPGRPFRRATLLRPGPTTTRRSTTGRWSTFFRDWIAVRAGGRDPGSRSFVLRDLFGESVILVRGRDDVIRASTTSAATAAPPSRSASAAPPSASSAPTTPGSTTSTGGWCGRGTPRTSRTSAWRPPA